MYKYVQNSVVMISLMFAQYFEYYGIMLGGRFFVDTLYLTEEAATQDIIMLWSRRQKPVVATKHNTRIEYTNARFTTVP